MKGNGEVDGSEFVQVGDRIINLSRIHCLKDSGSLLWVYFSGNDPAQLNGRFRDELLDAVNERSDFMRIGEYIVPLSQINYMKDLDEELSIYTSRTHPIMASGQIRAQVYKRLAIEPPVTPPPVFVRP